MKKQKRIFRDKHGRFTRDLRKVKSVVVGKRRFTNLRYVKKLLKSEKKKVRRKKQPEKIKQKKFLGGEPERIIFTQEIYQTQLGKLDASHTHKFEHITMWGEVNTESKMINKFELFYNTVRFIPKRATDVKFGIQAEDIETSQIISQYTGFMDLIFDKNEIKNLHNKVKGFVEALISLSERYLVQIKQAIITLIIHFKLKGHL